MLIWCNNYTLPVSSEKMKLLLLLCVISSPHGGEYEAQNLLVCTAVLLIEMSVDIQLRTRQYIPEDSELLLLLLQFNSPRCSWQGSPLMSANCQSAFAPAAGCLSM
jgi:hypothetical protein